MVRATLKSIGAHKRRLLSTCTAVVLGVAFLAGTLVMGGTMRSAFSDTFEKANAGMDAVVRSSEQVGDGEFAERGLIDAAVLDQVLAVDGVAAAEVMIDATGQVVGADGDPVGGGGPPTMAGNWVTDPGLNPWDVADGRAPGAPGEVAINRGAAEDGDLAVGDTITVRTPTPVEAELVGILTFDGQDSAGGPTYAAFTTDWAQELLVNEPGRVDQVVVAGDGSVGEEELAGRLAAALPDGVEAITAADYTQEQEESIDRDFIGFFETVLLVFAVIALVVASFSIYNTFSILVAQRTRESALLRALGASRRQVITSVVIEALVVGIVASAVGIVAGIGLAAGLLALAEASMGLLSTPLVVGATPVVVGAVVGMAVTLVASLAPALKASRVAPLAALRDVAIDRSGYSRARAVAGLAVTALGAAVTVAGASGSGSISLAGLGALVTLVGVVLLGPVVARPAAGLLGRPLGLRRGAMAGKLARQNAMRNPRRTAGTASALIVGIAVVAVFTVFGASVKRSIDNTVSEQFAGDLVIAQNDFSGAGISPELAPEVAALDEVETVASLSTAMMRVDDEDQFVAATDPSMVTRLIEVGLEEGSFSDLGAGGVAVSTDWADDHGVGVGDRVPVSYPDRASEELTVVATYEETTLMGDVIVPKDVWAPHAQQLSDEVVAIELAGGVSPAEGQAAIQPLADAYGAPDVQDRDEYVSTVAGQVDQMLVVVYVLLILAVVIALMGIANTLSLSIHERARELGLLRAVGQTRRQVRSMVRKESLVVALFGTVGGVVLGTFLGWAMVRALAVDGLAEFALPAGQLAVVGALGALVGVGAALRPARRAARLDVLTAIATD